MDAGFEELSVQHNLKCHVCGESQFEEREGFYYCLECGTKHEQVRIIEVDQEDEFDQEKLKAKKQKIHLTKAEGPQLTSWECYNYILRGFVEELLSFGAKEDLKLMALQVWAAYLRHMQVAFFNRKQPDLPKLGIKYFQNDAETIYNHKRKTRKKRNQKRNEDTSCTSGADSSFSRSKKKLDESQYSLLSGTSGGSGVTSSTSVNSTRAIKMQFSRRARSYFKRKMPIKHFEKHEADAEGLLTCHKQPCAREINRNVYNLMLVNIKQICSILAISLNLIGDEIQLSDLVRFIHEGHIDTSNVLQYFPENIASKGREMLKKINFYKCPEKYADKALRDHIGVLCKNIGILTVQKPDMIKLVRRYSTELCLPTDFANYIERLINLLPPRFNTRVSGVYPAFEARAMAYIIFALKLLFGLDDNKEYRMSIASKILNRNIQGLNRRKNENQALLFVWNDWVEYIEMRKIIVSQFNTSFCTQFKQCQSTDQLLEKMAEEIRRSEEKDNLLNDTSDNLHNKQKLDSFKSLLERFQETYNLHEQEKRKPLRIKFTPSLTPAHSYLKNIMVFCRNTANTTSSINIKIPDFMRVDHSQRDINSYLQVKPLISYFRRHQLNLNVHVLPTTKNKRYVGIFRSPRFRRTNYKIQKACFNITNEKWSEIVMGATTQNADDLEFVTDLTTQTRKPKSKPKEYFDPQMNYEMPRTKIKSSPKRKETNEDLQSMHSFEVFSENNMEPIEIPSSITKPRRNLENIDLFEGISDEESVLNDDNGDDGYLSVSSEHIINDASDAVLHSPQCDTALQSISSPPHDFEEFIKVEPTSPNTGRQDKSCNIAEGLKMFISNMDCWMLLGNTFMLSKAQKAQLHDKFPFSFKWLLETCAQTINVEWIAIFEQLLCVEMVLCLGINDPEYIKNCVYINNNNSIKEIEKILKTYHEIW